MEPGDLEVEGEVLRVTYENPDTGFRVVKIRAGNEDQTIVGVFAPVAVGSRVRARGSFELDKRHGKQLRVKGLTELMPETLSGIETFLGSGIIRGIGPSYAQRIVTAFGLDTLRVLDEAPERLLEVEGLGQRRVEAVARGWRDHRDLRDVMIFLEAHQASPALAARIYKRYGSRTIEVVKGDPYLLARDVWGVGFRTADRIAGSLGIAKDSASRKCAGIVQILRESQESGHTVAPRDDLLQRAATLLELDLDPSIDDALESLVRGNDVIVERDAEHGDLVIPAVLDGAERRIAARLRQIMTLASTPEAQESYGALVLDRAETVLSSFEKSRNVTLADEQRRAVLTAARERMLIVTGGPGVGKTTVVRAMLAMYRDHGLSVRLAAPTGRAAKRMTEATGAPASTLHRLLEFDPKTYAFKRDARHPLEGHVLVVDETSMMDLTLADCLLAAVPDGMRVVFVGDVDQLPSVGAGAVLRDLLASNVVPFVRLEHIFRQGTGSLITVNAHKIRAGEMPELHPETGGAASDFFLIERSDAERARATVVEVVAQRIPHKFGFHPVRDVQVLVPMHRGACGSEALNAALQEALNPHGRPLVAAGTGSPNDRAASFREGDKVMQLKNDPERAVWNGDVGIILTVDPEERALTVRFDEGAHARDVAYDGANLHELTLAYACTVHKSQGSEYPAVVMVALTSHFVMLARNLLYTGVTRGKSLVVLVSSTRALQVALAEERRFERKTRLAERMREAIASPH